MTVGRVLRATGAARSGVEMRVIKTATVLTAMMIQPIVGMLCGSAGAILPCVSNGKAPIIEEPKTPMLSIQPNIRERSL